MRFSEKETRFEYLVLTISVSRDDNNTVADSTQLYVREQDNPELLHHAAYLKPISSNDFTSCYFLQSEWLSRVLTPRT
jgi:hypothetical protein